LPWRIDNLRFSLDTGQTGGITDRILQMPSSSTSPSFRACRRKISAVRKRPDLLFVKGAFAATARTNWEWTLPINSCSRRFSSGRMVRVGEPMSLCSPLLMTLHLEAILPNSSSRLTNSSRTPMLPVMVPGLAKIFCAGTAM
jgi:hypothetical protein